MIPRVNTLDVGVRNTKDLIQTLCWTRDMISDVVSYHQSADSYQIAADSTLIDSSDSPRLSNIATW